jgi:hypothetical protein
MFDPLKVLHVFACLVITFSFGFITPLVVEVSPNVGFFTGFVSLFAGLSVIGAVLLPDLSEPELPLVIEDAFCPYVPLPAIVLRDMIPTTA